MVAWRTYANDTANNWNATPITTFTITSQAPQWSLQNQNESVVETFDDVLVWAFWSDNFEVNQTWLEHNRTGSFTNYSCTTVSNKTYNSTFIIDTDNFIGTVAWRIWSNDSIGNINATALMLFQVVDTTPPKWDSQSQNDSNPGQFDSVLLSARVWDNLNLSYAILSTNETGAWANKTILQMTHDNSIQWSNFTWQNNSVPSLTWVGWRIWYNDTSNNYNVTRHHAVPEEGL